MMHTVSTRAASVSDYDYTDHPDLIYSLALQLLLLRGSVPEARVTSFLCVREAAAAVVTHMVFGGRGRNGRKKKYFKCRFGKSIIVS